MEKFTDNKIKSLKPRSKTYTITEGCGFYMKVTPRNFKVWCFRYYSEKQNKWLIIGYYPQMGLAKAREKYNELYSQWQAGIDPKIHLKQLDEKKHNTVRLLVNQWYENYISKERKQPQQVKQIIDADIIPLLGEKELDKLEVFDITKALDLIVSRGAPVHANKVLASLKQAFSYGKRRGMMKDNSASDIKARDIGGIEKPRDRTLAIDEIKILLGFLDTDENRMSLQLKNAIKIILHTGIRTSELRLATWQEIDFESSLWTIPKAHTKQGKEMKIHLTHEVKKLFKVLEKHSSSVHIISIKGDKPLTDKAMPRAINRIQTRVNIPKWTAHDLRRTFATQLSQTLRIDPVVIEKCLGHKMPKIMATYNKNEMLPERLEALEQWSQLLKSLNTNNVIQLQKPQAMSA